MSIKMSADLKNISAFPQLVQQRLDQRQQLRVERDSARTFWKFFRDSLGSNDSAFSEESLLTGAKRAPGSIAVSVQSELDRIRCLAAAGEALRNAKDEKGHAEHALRELQNSLKTAQGEIRQLQESFFGIGFLQRLLNWSFESSLQARQASVEKSRQLLSAAQTRLDSANAGTVQAEQRVDKSKADLLQWVVRNEQNSEHGFSQRLEAHASQWSSTLRSMPPFVRCDWSEASWKAYQFKESWRVPFWVAGMAEEQSHDSTTPFVIPHFAPLLGSKRSTILKGKPQAAQSLMQGLILQLAAMLPYGATFTLLDPSGAGRAFPMQRGLPFVRPVGADMARDLDTVLDDIARIIRTYLDGETSSFETLPEEIQANERYEFIFAANFPAGYDRRAIESLQKVAKNGAVAGKYLFLQISSEKDLPPDLNWKDFGETWTVDADRPPQIKELPTARVDLLRGAEGAAQRVVLQSLAVAKPPEHNVRWNAITDNDPAHWWTEDSAEIIQAPVGSSGRDRLLNLWFGVNRDGRPCAHGILGAMPGSGKSNLYHVLICGLAVRYGPEQLNFYLIDGKMGVEFQPYRRLPHARVVALNSAPELSRSVVAELVAEMERRNEVFGKTGVVDLPGYRRIGSTMGPRPRIVLMIDEYQELFEDDRYNHASAHLLTLAQQGRSAGIHLILGSQRFGAPGMLNQAAVFGSIHMRMAMRMSQTDVQGLMEFGRNGKRLVEQCDLPGKIVINANSGDDNSNEFGKVALMDSVERTVVLDALVEKAGREWPAERRFATVVFDGREQPNFAENPQVVDLLRLPRRPSTEAWRKVAAAPIHEQGFGVPDWYAGERPLALWLGQELNVHGQARIILRRRAMENVLMVGESLGVIYGVVAGMLCSMTVNEPPSGLQLWIADRAVPGTPWDGLIETLGSELTDQLGYKTCRTREPKQAVKWLDDWSEELNKRLAMDESEIPDQPTWIMIILGADRIPQLARTMSNFGATVDSTDGEKLRNLYTRGPTMGLHVVLAFGSATSMKQCLDRSQMEQFKHRVVTQISEADSFLLLGNDLAAKLQRGDSRPFFAIGSDQAGGSVSKFKPYTVESQMPWSQQLRFVRENLARWKENANVNG